MSVYETGGDNEMMRSITVFSTQMTRSSFNDSLRIQSADVQCLTMREKSS